MSEQHDDTPAVGWLLLRDGHAIPIIGLEPDALKAARRRAVEAPETPLKHTTGLNAIVDTLGFEGDFGDYSRTHWPRLTSFLGHAGCKRRVDAFARTYDADALFFGPFFGPKRQDLADRYFLGPQPPPGRVFLGTGVEWGAWYERARGTFPRSMWPGDEEFVPKEREEAIRWLLQRRTALMDHWGFLDDKLIEGPVEHVVDKTYFPLGFDPAERDRSRRMVLALMRAFRFVFNESSEGWVDILPFNERLAFLRTRDGGYDIIWKNLRDAPPPPEDAGGAPHGLHVVDVPKSLAQEGDLARRLYFRPDVWRESEAHVAEQHFYDRGGTAAERRREGSSEVIEIYLRDTGVPTVVEQAAWSGDPPAGFTPVEVDGQRLLVGDLVTVGEFRRMLAETGYLERRKGDAWERANANEADDAPVGASWQDAQAFCAWRERQLGVSLRLLTVEEHRALRSFMSKHYADLAMQDFPWEEWPPRLVGSVVPPSAVCWSEPRFEESSAEHDELPDEDGSRGRKRWIVDFPPRARWAPALPWANHRGLTFIDAWDAYEWCQERGWISGRYWEGPIAADCWGAYKNVKVGFRVVMLAG